jgi:drug/metabolite transporter (DMT)-like permease
VAWAWLGEVPTAAQLVGAAVIIGGVHVVRHSLGGGS